MLKPHLWLAHKSNLSREKHGYPGKFQLQIITLASSREEAYEQLTIYKNLFQPEDLDDLGETPTVVVEIPEDVEFLDRLRNAGAIV
jgi:hypothetical protein